MKIKIKRRVVLSAVLGLMVLFLLSSSAGMLFSQEWERSLLDKNPNPTFVEIQKHFYDYWKKKGIKQYPGWKQFKRWEWFAETRLDAKGYLSPTLNWAGWLEKNRRFASGQSPAGSQWTQLGPVTVPASYSQDGYPGMGRLNCMAFHPTTPSTMWVGAPAGGLWKTTDGGATWSSQTDQLPNLGVTSILVHPGNPNIMYIGTGDGDGRDTYSIGVLKSTDGGQTWNTTGMTRQVSERWTISKLLMHPSNPDIIVGAFSTGIYKTTDGGSTWNQQVSGNFKDIEVDSSTPSVWYAANAGSGVYKSTDSGNTWTRKTNGLPSEGAGFGRIAIALAPGAQSIIYALYAKSEGGGFFGIYRSVDRGESWALRAGSPNLLGWSRFGGDSGGQGWYDLSLAVHPADANTVFSGGVNVWKSVDGGTSWNVSAVWNGGAGQEITHADHHALVFHPQDNNTIYSCNDGGLFRSSNNGDNWSDLSSGLAIHQVYRLGVSAQDPTIIVTGNQDNGSDLHLPGDSGGWKSIFGGDGMECAINPLNSKQIFCSIYFGDFFRSTDSGRIWTGISGEFGGDGAWITPFQLDAKDPTILYVAATRVYKSTDSGNTWTAISGELVAEPMRHLAVAPSNSSYIYAGDFSSLFATSDGGVNWTGVSTSAFPSGITSITVHPRNPRYLWVTIGGYWAGQKVFQSTDGGGTWSDFSGALPNIPVNCMVVDPASFGVYIGTDLGVFYATAGSASWEAFDSGLPNVVVSDLDIHVNATKILAATFGRGVWESPLANAPSVFPPGDFSAERRKNRSFFFLEYLDRLTWSTNPANEDNNLTNYRIYRVEGDTLRLLTEVSTNTFQYDVRKVENIETIYAISSVDEEGNESVKTYTRLD
ncbi:MAG: hypothetical protein GY940_44510 [bacterium]|nr:hypothetical protein [bacterium]